MDNTGQQGFRNGQSYQQDSLQKQQQFQVQPQDTEIEGSEDSNNYLQNLEVAIEQLMKIVDNPSSSARMSASQSQEQFQVLLEKYQKIEQLVSLDQDQINQLVNTHLQLQSDLSQEYGSYQNIIAQGKYDIIQATIVNKQALLYQSKGQMKVQAKQKVAESLDEEVAALKKELSKNNQLMQEKSILEKTLDEQNLRFSRTIEEFQKDQGEQKGGMESSKQQILQGEKEIKQVKKEQLDMQRKLELLKKTTRDIKQKTVQYQSAKEVAATELRNEKRMLLVSERKYQELQQGLQSLETEIERSNEHRLQIVQVNENLKRKVHLVQSSMLVNSYEGAEVEELKALEGLLGQYNSLVSEKTQIITEKQNEKAVLEEHLSQLSLFAQQYIEKQEQQEKQKLQELQNQEYQQQLQFEQYQLQQKQQLLQQQQQAQLSKQQQFQQQQLQQQQYQMAFQQIQDHQEHVGQEEYDMNDGNSHNIHDQQDIHDGMERIQSQYEQEQDSLTLPHPDILPTKAVPQSNESGYEATSLPANHPIFQNYQPQEDHIEIADNQQNLQGREERIHVESALDSKQDEGHQEVIELPVEQSKNENQTSSYPNKLESTIQTHVDNNQAHVDTPSDFENLNIEKYSPQHESNSQEELIQNQLYHKYDPTVGSFGGQPEGNSEESPVEQHNFLPFPGGAAPIEDNGLDPEQQLIAKEFSQGDIQVSSTVKLSEFLKQQEEKEKRENGNNQPSSNPSDSSKALSHENKRILAQISLPGIGYQKIMNELKNSMHKNGLLQQQQQGQQEQLDQQKQQQLIDKNNK